MSAINLLTVNPSADRSSASALLTPGASSRDSVPHSFRDELSSVDTAATPAARSSTTTKAERPEAGGDDPVAKAETSVDKATPVGDLSDDAGLSEVDEASDTADNDLVGEAEGQSASPASENAAVSAIDEAVVVEGEDPVLSLVADLVVAIENVFANTPVTEGLADPEALASPQAPVLSALVAVYEALQAVTAANGLPRLNATSPLSTAVIANPLAATAAAVGGANTAANSATSSTPASSATPGTATGEGVVPAPVVSPESGSTGQQTEGEAGGETNRQSATNNPVASSTTGAAPLPTAVQAGNSPLVDPTAGNPLKTTIAPPANPANAAGLSTQIDPAGLTETNSTQDALNAARLTRGLNSAVNQQNGSVTLRLTPPEMGTVRIQLNMQGGSVSAQFHAETESARTLLNQQLGQLRNSLEAQGLNVEKLGVQAMAGSSSSSGLQQQAGNDSSQNQAQNNADGRSRGQFGQSSQQGRQGQDPDDPTRNAPTEFTQLLDADAAARV